MNLLCSFLRRHIAEIIQISCPVVSSSPCDVVNHRVSSAIKQNLITLAERNNTEEECISIQSTIPKSKKEDEEEADAGTFCKLPIYVPTHV